MPEWLELTGAEKERQHAIYWATRWQMWSRIDYQHVEAWRGQNPMTPEDRHETISAQLYHADDSQRARYYLFKLIGNGETE